MKPKHETVKQHILHHLREMIAGIEAADDDLTDITFAAFSSTDHIIHGNTYELLEHFDRASFMARYQMYIQDEYGDPDDEIVPAGEKVH